MNNRLQNQLNITTHIAHRGSKALLAIESLAYKADVILKSTFTPAEEKVKMLTELNQQIITKVMEGTSDVYVAKE